MARSRELGRGLVLLFINPDDFAVINERFGRELLSDQSLASGRAVAQKIRHRLSEASFLSGALRLGFSVGLAAFDPGEGDTLGALELVRRADQALNAAKRSGGDSVTLWEKGSEAEEAGNLDRLSGIFTGNMAKDYRNMVLLWDSVSVMAQQAEFEGLAAQVVEKLYTTFKPERVGLYSRAEQDELSLIQGRVPRRAGVGGAEKPSIELSRPQRELIEQARLERRTYERRFPIIGPGGRVDGEACAYAVPLIAGGDCLGCLYLDGRAGTLSLDSSDLFFLEALASQLAVAFDRFRLAEQEKRRQEVESRRLRAELEELRAGVRKAKLEYRSQEMEALLSTARRVAPTDATVLITGESGTGKEILARTIHELSPRRGRPLVVVDCGAIASSLIDSELFGHERGAYTGAQQRRVGRLAEAEGATVLLDEISELPLDVQSKLLRFVQERQLTPVGGSRPRAVDVRVIAATNQDLVARVAEGLFREDLYYRLNVVRLVVPPLRERPEDVLHLAQHYLDVYAAHYEKDVRRLQAEAQALLIRHHWPGNVRELQNRIMQAVILCEGEEIGPAELGFLDPEATDSSRPGERRSNLHSGIGPGAPVRELPNAQARSPRAPSLQFLWGKLRECLARHIEAAVNGQPRRIVPLGRWVSDDLVLAADGESGGVARRGASILGLPETTYRRRLRRAVDPLAR
jgi:transcriptional regulator with GAF, ATPase, and Fis domain